LAVPRSIAMSDEKRPPSLSKIDMCVGLVGKRVLI
jgi:hypothetical protein